MRLLEKGPCMEQCESGQLHHRMFGLKCSARTLACLRQRPVSAIMNHCGTDQHTLLLRLFTNMDCYERMHEAKQGCVLQNT